MRFCYIFYFIILSSSAIAQENNSSKSVHTKSWYKACYKVPADSAFVWLKKNATNLVYLDQLTPIAILPDSVSSDSAKLGIGQYIWVKSNYDKIECYWEQISKLSSTIFDDGLQTKLLLYNNNGQAVTSAYILAADKQAKYSINAQAYILSTKKWKEDETYLIRAATPNDTLIFNSEKENKNRGYYNYTQKNKWKGFPVIRQIRGIGLFLKRIFSGNQKYHYQASLRTKQKETGFVLFSKPLYKPGDTVKLKAWITDRREKPSISQQSLWINYRANGSYKNFELANISPVSAGSYPYSFALPDSFPNDTQYSLDFRGPKKYNHLNASFKMEEYQLPDISKFEFSVDHHEVLLAKDTLGFSFEANGTNGLPLLDASVDVVVFAGNVNHFYKDSLFIADTLFQKTYTLQTDGKTTAKIPANIFPKADMELKLIATLKNSSNETTVKNEQVMLYQQLRKVEFTKQKKQLQIDYTEEGKSIAHTALVSIAGDLVHIDTVLQLPTKVAFHPLANEYSVQVYDQLGKRLLYAEYDLKDSQKPTIETDSRGDSIGFVCNNPDRLVLNYTLIKGKEIVWEQQDSSSNFSWYKKADAKHIFHLHVNYLLKGEAQQEDIRLAVYFKKITVNLVQQNMVQPGAKDTLKVTVTDYKNQAVPFANLTVSGQNTQLKEHFHFPSLPLSMNFKDKYKTVSKYNFPLTEPNLKTSDTVTHFTHILKHLGLDSMQFYQWLNITKPLLLQRYSISNLFPEINVKAIAHGSPETIFITYLNKEASSCIWQNANQPFSTQVYPGYVQVGIRTRKKYIQVDSIYMQPYYKHELFINLDSIAKMQHVTVVDLPDTLLLTEKNALQKRFLQLEANPTHNNVWLWQGSVATQISDTRNNLIIGPFNSYDSIYAFKQNAYQFKFPFESGFTYRLSKNLVRMEKTSFFQTHIPLPKSSTRWHIGDTIPNIQLPKTPTVQQALHSWATLKNTYHPYSTGHGNGTLQLQTVFDSGFVYAVLIPYNNIKAYTIYAGSTNIFHNLKVGRYKLILVSKRFLAYTNTDIYIQKNGLSCYTIHPKIFNTQNLEMDSILDLHNPLPTDLPIKQEKTEKEKIDIYPIPLIVPYGKSNIVGKVFDKTGKAAIIGASILIKGTTRAIASNLQGEFVLQNLAAGDYTLQINMIGYLSKTIQVNTLENESAAVNVGLDVSNQSLDEVVVIGYGTQRKMSLTGSVSQITSNEIFQSLEGRLAGLSVDGNAQIRIRGNGSITNDNKPLVVVDGVLMDEIPIGMDTSIVKIEILKDATATSIYGARAANGVIIISTGRNNGPAIRTKFKDDAYWIPNTVTDENGMASIPIQYPDNITNWQNIVYAAAKKGRYGRAFSITKAFKSVQGLLTVPAFLTVGDSVQLVGKAMNFSANLQTLSSSFTQGLNKLQSSITLTSNASNTQNLGIKAPNEPDTLKASFVVTDSKKNADGEERTIPIFERGTVETKGQFLVLDGDTTLQFKPSFDGAPINFYTENKLTDVLEKELENLINYPQACMEQTANKLWGLIMLRQIKTAQHLPFSYEKLIAGLIDRLVKNQQLDGGWPWWPGGNSNLYITTKVLQALRQIAPTETINQSMRNGFIYLQNQLANKNIYNKLEVLSALAEGKHVYPYQLALDTIHFDSLTTHQQWQWTRIRQKVGLDYKPELEKLLRKKQSTITGGIFWGIENWHWYSNQNATTVLAFRVLGDDSLYKHLLPHLKQYFLEQKSNGYYRNTVEQAEISALLLTSALQKTNDTTATELTIENRRISQFPSKGAVDFSKAVNITKKGKGLVYLGLSQQFQNKNPQKVDSLFDVHSTFTLKNTDTLQGESVQLPLAAPINIQINIVVKKEAQFVQIEIPIPAGMVYASKPQVGWNEHREYLKNKVLIFKEQLTAGKYHFTIPLETRFSGKFALNPAKVELMYFPMFFGREGMKEVGIE